FAPHLCEEMWEKSGHKKSIFHAAWPEYNPEILIVDELEIVIQIKGKVREHMKISRTDGKEETEEKALKHGRIPELTEGKRIVKVIVIPGKLVNIVAV
ncbi:MAG: class I tRNA ligase family protein, partial [Calditrichia bacterium]|nr:class I tRNA ligase family protein [Calditrichia bacterium]